MMRAAVSYVEREDGRMLCVWNKRYGGWSLPGGMVEDGERVDAAVVRELSEETGLAAIRLTPIYDGPFDNEDPASVGRAKHVHVFRVEAIDEPTEQEIGCPVTWLTREEFLKWSPFAAFYRKMFDAVPSRVTR